MTGEHSPVRPDAQQLADILHAAYTCRHENVTHGDRCTSGHLVGVVVHHCATCGIPVSGEACGICNEGEGQ